MSKETESKLYEISYLIEGRLGTEKAQEIADKIREILDTAKNVVVESAPLKTTKLAYAVKKQSEAFWSWIRFMASPKDLSLIKTKTDRIPEILRAMIMEAKPEEVARRPMTAPKKRIVTAEEIARVEEIDKKLEEILGT